MGHGLTELRVHVVGVEAQGVGAAGDVNCVLVLGLQLVDLLLHYLDHELADEDVDAAVRRF